MEQFVKVIYDIRENGSKETVNCECFSGPNELVDVCMSRTRTSEFSQDHFANIGFDAGWTGAKSIDECLDYLRHGWKEKVEDVRKVFKEVDKTMPTVKNHKWTTGVEGYVPHVPNAIIGVPNSMIRQETKLIKSKIISLEYMFEFDCGKSKDQILTAGFDLVKAVIRLEKQGYRVRLCVDTGFYGNGSADFVQVLVKREDQPLDIQKIMFPMMHPAMFRGIFFGWYERCPTAKYRNGYGCPIQNYLNNTDKEQKLIEGILGTESIALNGAYVIRGGLDYIENRLKSKGIAGSVKVEQR